MSLSWDLAVNACVVATAVVFSYAKRCNKVDLIDASSLGNVKIIFTLLNKIAIFFVKVAII